MSSKITKISAKPRESQTPTGQTPAKISKTDRKLRKKAKNRPTEGDEKPLKSVFILFRPFVALGRYLRDSWRELRMVRWPSRKATWKMTLAVLVYCAIFIAFIVLLDMFFTFIFNLIFGTN